MKNILIKVFVILLVLLSSAVFAQKVTYDTMYIEFDKVPVDTSAPFQLVFDSAGRIGKIYSGGGFVADSIDCDRAVTRVSWPYAETPGTSVNTSVEALEWLLFPFVPATIALSSSGVYEVGTSNTRTLTSTITANSETVFTSGYINMTSPAVATMLTWTGGGTKTVSVTFTPTQGITDSLTKQFVSYEVVGNNGVPATINSSTLTLSSCYPYLYGNSATDYSSGVGAYAALTKSVVTSKATATFNCATLQYFYFCYPASYGALTSIKDHNGFEQITAFTKYTVNITSAGLTNNWTTSYYVYMSNTPATTLGSDWPYTFTR